MTNIKRLAALFLAVCAILSLSACGEEGDTENALFDSMGAISQVTVYGGKNEGSYVTNADGKIGEIVGYDVLYQTDSQEDVDQIIAMFAGWDMDARKVADDDILDLACDIYIRFDDVLTLSCCEDGKAVNYYGTVEGVPYYLPAEFGEFVDSVLQGA